MIENSWLLVYTHSGKESLAVANLNNQKIETYCPVESVERPNGLGKKKIIVRPLFPRYVFARFDIESLFRPVRNTRGVHSLVRFGEEPITVTDADIEIIRLQLSQPLGTAQPSEYVYAVGRMLQIIDTYSSFYGRQGRYKRADRKSGNLVVEFDAPNFGRPYEAFFTAANVMAV